MKKRTLYSCRTLAAHALGNFIATFEVKVLRKTRATFAPQQELGSGSTEKNKE